MSEACKKFSHSFESSRSSEADLKERIIHKFRTITIHRVRSTVYAKKLRNETIFMMIARAGQRAEGIVLSNPPRDRAIRINACVFPAANAEGIAEEMHYI